MSDSGAADSSRRRCAARLGTRTRRRRTPPALRLSRTATRRGCGRISSPVSTAGPPPAANPANWAGPATGSFSTCCGSSLTSSWSARAPCGSRVIPARSSSVAQRQRRQARGQSEVPQLAIVTRVRPPGPGYAGVHPHRGATAGAHLHGGGRQDAPRAHRPRRGGRLLRQTIPADVDEAAVLAVAGRSRTAPRILTEGGPTLLGSFIEARPARRAVPDHRALHRRRPGPAASRRARARC